VWEKDATHATAYQKESYWATLLVIHFEVVRPTSELLANALKWKDYTEEEVKFYKSRPNSSVMYACKALVGLCEQLIRTDFST
jgi:hypothetical protein